MVFFQINCGDGQLEQGAPLRSSVELVVVYFGWRGSAVGLRLNSPRRVPFKGRASLEPSQSRASEFCGHSAHKRGRQFAKRLDSVSVLN